MSKKVLVLCHGNVNRSALCHYILAEYEGLEVKSAGVKPDLRPGKAAKKMRDAALELGVNLEEHRSQLITTDLYRWADVIIYMDGGNLKRLQHFWEDRSWTLKSDWRCLGEFAVPIRNRIPDPGFIKRGTQEFHDVVSLIHEASHNLAKKLIAE